MWEILPSDCYKLEFDGLVQDDRVGVRFVICNVALVGASSFSVTILLVLERI